MKEQDHFHFAMMDRLFQIMVTYPRWLHLYDLAVFLSDDECKEKYNMEVNVQSEVEKPELYMLARCQSNDNQLLYSEQ